MPVYHILRESSKRMRMQEAKRDDYQWPYDVILRREATVDRENVDLEFDVHKHGLRRL